MESVVGSRGRWDRKQPRGDAATVVQFRIGIATGGLDSPSRSDGTAALASRPSLSVRRSESNAVSGGMVGKRGVRKVSFSHGNRNIIRTKGSETAGRCDRAKKEAGLKPEIVISSVSGLQFSDERPYNKE